MRVVVVLGACLVVSACGGTDGAEKQAARGGELTVMLPPSPGAAPVEEPAPQAGFETVAAVPPAPAPATPAKAPPPVVAAAPEEERAPADVEVTVAPAETGQPADASSTDEPAAASAGTAPAAQAARPAGASAWAGYLRRAGFPCRRIAAAERVERQAGPGLAYYRVQCEGGPSYQATDKNGHLYFRRWRG